ncbi:DNA-directed RNA polymerase subunit epsilon [Cytobacillus sp. S13-E01]|uniref:DNA-dependent RNA polymerase subunit epsilon n=1 Tax=Cytobacillus sp. S13-E01 TaxID=3031326 RepID=UPI0023D7FEBF|nr:DNA-directed RNA polymerase subunit epsilon [Cytobacillus sp. S13-E01]MDF0725359.1 DNA-directed RNA polymerase subunit epsilon [Cytobacillus sp. S13-E01]
MIFKVYYQEPGNEVPIRERTKTMFVEAEAERYVREKLKDRNINIELVQRIQGAHLEYEQQNVDYKVLEI